MGKIANNLPAGSKIDNYVIERTLGGGGFSIVYLAFDRAQKKRVVIKEYMPGKMAQRINGHNVAPVSERHLDTFTQGRKLFFQEARILATLKHPNIVNVINFFQAHGTVYLVMDYEVGANLQSYIESHHGNLSAIFIRTVFPLLLDGLNAMHGHGLLHLDIKPGNIHLRPGGRPLLLDFGAAHSMRLDQKYPSGKIITPGFSPIEQYDNNGYVGPWSDIYAIGATMRACIEGAPPPAADRRATKDTMRPAVNAFKRRYPLSLLQAIDWAMEPDPLCRPQTVIEYLQALLQQEPSEQHTKTMFDRLVNNLPWNK